MNAHRPPANQPLREYCWLACLALCLFLPSIWSETSVTGGDEYRLSLRTPIEMAERGQWLTPWLDGQPRLQKPPLLYWAILATYKTAGIHLASARIWGVLSGIGLVVFTAMLARRINGRDGWLAGMLALGSVGVAVEARRAMLDLPLAAWTTLALWAWIGWVQSGRWRQAAGAAAALGMACLVKGPAGLWFFLAGAIAFLAGSGQWRVLKLRWVHLAGGLAVWLAVSLPWPLAMWRLWPEAFQATFAAETQARGFGQIQLSPLISAITGALGLVFPWTLVVLGTVIAALRMPRPERNPYAWLWLWLVISVLPFLAMRTFERYLLAIVPVQCMLAARWLEDDPGMLPRLALRLSTVLLGGALLFFCGFALWFRLGWFWPAAGLAVVLWLALEASGRCRPRWLAGGVSVGLAVFLGGLYPAIGINALPDRLAETIGGRTAFQFANSQPSMLSMRLKTSVRELSPAAKVFDWPAFESGAVVFVEASRHGEFAGWLQQENLEAKELGRFATFYSRKAWIRFARAGASWEDWKAAARARSLDGLKTGFQYYRVRSRM